MFFIIFLLLFCVRVLDIKELERAHLLELEVDIETEVEVEVEIFKKWF